MRLLHVTSGGNLDDDREKSIFIELKKKKGLIQKKRIKPFY